MRALVLVALLSIALVGGCSPDAPRSANSPRPPTSASADGDAGAPPLPLAAATPGEAPIGSTAGAAGCGAGGCVMRLGELETSGYGTCSVRPSGALSCWGDVGGDESRGPTAPVTTITNARDVVQVSLGRDSQGAFESCLLRKDGAVLCWGDNRNGQVDPTAPGKARRGAVVVAGIPPASEVRVLGDLACALTRVELGGALFCWDEHHRKPVAVAGVRDALHLARTGSCVVLRGGGVACAADKPTTKAPHDFVPVPGVSGAVHVVEIAGSSDPRVKPYRCAFRTEGEPICWSAGGGATPVAFPALRNAVDLQGQEDADPMGKGPATVSGCFLRRDGTVGCTPDMTKLDKVKDMPELTPSLAIAWDSTLTCGLSPAGDVWCHGQLGMVPVDKHGSLVRATPVEVVDVADAVELSAAANHTCVRTASGKVLCWGKVPTGFAKETPHARPVPIPGVRAATALGVGDQAVCAVEKDGSVVCSGLGPGGLRTLYGGKLGADYDPTKKLAGVRDLVQLGLGGEGCGVRANGTVLCWTNASGGITPHELAGVTDAKQVVVTDDEICIARRSGTVACQREGAALTEVPGVADVARLDASGNYVRTDGSVASFALGGNRAREWKIAGARDVASSSGSHRCVVRTNGSVLCMGSNDAGELGDGTYEKRAGAVVVQGVDDAVAVACGWEHTCALRKNGRVVCWGSNDGGILGNGETVNRTDRTTAKVALPP